MPDARVSRLTESRKSSVPRLAGESASAFGAAKIAPSGSFEFPFTSEKREYLLRRGSDGDDGHQIQPNLILPSRSRLASTYKYLFDMPRTGELCPTRES
jgi:hypothetical protein